MDIVGITTPGVPPGTVVMRYPGNDPENGPAYRQRWNGNEWVCAAHRFRARRWCAEYIGSGDTGLSRACTRCGQPWDTNN